MPRLARTCCTLAMLTAPLLAGCDSGVEDAPFAGAFTTTFTFTPTAFDPDTGAPTRASVPLDGAGEATALGPSTFTAEQDVDLTTGRGTARLTFVAADGDRLTAVDTVTFAPPDPQGRFPFAGTLTVTGGTGRFADARGTAALTGTVDQPAGTGTFALDGALSY